MNPNSSVRFNDFISIPKKLNDREKYLTAKYPAEQMQLIRKRLSIEFWLDDQLRSLYDVQDDADHDHCPADLIDSLLDIEDQSEREKFLMHKFVDVKQNQSTVLEFVDQVLARVKML